MKLDKDKVKSRWYPVLENMGICNEQFKEVMALYSEWFQLNETDELPKSPTNINVYSNTSGSNGMGSVMGNATGLSQSKLPKELHSIKNKLTEIGRVEIVGQYFNVGLGIAEYKLSNNFYVPINNFNKSVKYEDVLFDKLIDIFPMEFLSEVYPNESRDFKINSLYNE